VPGSSGCQGIVSRTAGFGTSARFDEQGEFSIPALYISFFLRVRLYG